jgi:zinc transport system substrate-binding protein
MKAAILLLAPAGCTPEPSRVPAAGSLQVVAAVYPLEWLAQAIGSDQVTVTNLTPPGAEPHDLELPATAIRSVQSADLVLYLGTGFQPAVDDAVAQSGAAAIDVLSLDGLDLIHLDEEHSGHSSLDPHVWLDPVRFQVIAAAVGQELGLDPAPAVAVLAELHRQFEAGLADCDRRQMVVSHAAFGYLADRYDLDQVAISGLSPEAEPLPQDLGRIAALADTSGATTIFFETLVSPRLSETVAREIGATTAVLDPIEGVDPARKAVGVAYPDLMSENLAALRLGLGCR